MPPKRSVNGKDQQTLAQHTLKNDQQLSTSDVTINQYCSSTDAPFDLKKPKPLIGSPKILPRLYYVSFVAVANVVISLNSTNEIGSFNFLPYFLTKSGIADDNAQQNEMGIATGIVYSVAHLLMMYGALRFSNTSIVYLSLVQVMLANILLCFPQAHAILHWFALICLCFGFSTAFPALLSFIESRINITNSVNCLFLGTFSFLSAFYSLFVGEMLQSVTLFQFVNLSLSTVILVLFVGLHLFDSWRKTLLAQR